MSINFASSLIRQTCNRHTQRNTTSGKDYPTKLYTSKHHPADNIKTCQAFHSPDTFNITNNFNLLLRPFRSTICHTHIHPYKDTCLHPRLLSLNTTEVLLYAPHCLSNHNSRPLPHSVYI